MTRANIYINDRFCGTLVESSDGYTFRYDEEYIKSEGAVQLSPTMPLQEEVFEKEFIFPVFDGLSAD